MGTEDLTIKPDLEGVELWLTDLRGIDLSNTNLRSARLFATNLRKANLRWCDLRGAVIHGGHVEPVDLRDCKLTRSDWREADVRRVRYNNQMSCAGIRVTDC